jgi:3-(methylthio)propanoyl-CoA dehydrogenase
MRSMIYTGAYWSELALELPPGEEKSHYQALVDFLTPIIKAYCSDLGFKVCETAIQCLGGYGFCREYPLEQYLRDSKIMSLYEGTNGIQSIDLLGRKMRLNGGALFQSYLSEIRAFGQKQAEAPRLRTEIRALSEAVDRLETAALALSAKMKTDPLQWASYTYPALLCFGDITMAWRLLDLAVIAQEQIDAGKGSDFLLGKVLQASYFTGTTLPLTLARLETCLREGREVVEMPENAF